MEITSFSRLYLSEVMVTISIKSKTLEMPSRFGQSCKRSILSPTNNFFATVIYPNNGSITYCQGLTAPSFLSKIIAFI